MGKTRVRAKQSTKADAGKTAVADAKKAGVKRKIGKAKKGIVEKRKGADALPEQKAASSVAAAVAQVGPRARRAAVAAAAAARMAGKSSHAQTSLPKGLKPKMTGELMMEEIEAARSHADKVAEIAAGAGSKSKRRRNSKRGLSQHSREVLAAFRVGSAAPELPFKQS
eukprot:TRINITY_DN79710_c0_g1_i1.p1 TRINITY_DN79710_c0_g1~~TRINITY_DN79710_c0_g1_i1.p1  ORF type:complete len:168 (+),score=47.18 TRINITY_DN79710_c0_g1_i1:37-540(+)